MLYPTGKKRPITRLTRVAFLMGLTCSSLPVASVALGQETPQEPLKKQRTVHIEIQRRPQPVLEPPTTEPRSVVTTGDDAGDEVSSVSLANSESRIDISPDSPLARVPDQGQPPTPSSSTTKDDSHNGDDLEESEKASIRPKPLTLGTEPKKQILAEGASGDSKSKDEVAGNEKSSRHRLRSNSSDKELSVEDEQARDEGECPGGIKGENKSTPQLGDLPLEQDDHPFDAPQATLEVPVQRAAPKKPDQTHMDANALRIKKRVDACLVYYLTHPENLAKRSPWAVMHAIIPFGVESDIIAGNRKVNSIGWMCYNGLCRTQRMFQPTQTGFRTNVGAGVQGHEGQFLAILAQSGVPRDFPIMVGKTRYTVNDLVRYEMANCREKSELTFQLIGLAHYLPPNQSWRDNRGHVWNIEKMVQEELAQPIVGAACGGTHRLMGLSYAVVQRQVQGHPISGQFARADVYLKDFENYAWSLQNPDGSFSTDWFEGRANEPKMERKVQTTGHILEWLMFRLKDEELSDPRIRKSIEFLLSQIYDHRDQDWPIGPRGHALRALSLYEQRVHGAVKGQMRSYLAKVGATETLR